MEWARPEPHCTHVLSGPLLKHRRDGSSEALRFLCLSDRILYCEAAGRRHRLLLRGRARSQSRSSSSSSSSGGGGNDGGISEDIGGIGGPCQWQLRGCIIFDSNTRVVHRTDGCGARCHAGCDCGGGAAAGGSVAEGGAGSAVAGGGTGGGAASGDGDDGGSGRGGGGGSGGAAASGVLCDARAWRGGSFALLSPTKSFIVEAADAVQARQWVDAIRAALGACVARTEQRRRSASTGTAAAADGGAPAAARAPILSSAAQCNMCSLEFSKVMRPRQHCGRCGAAVCSACSVRRVNSSGSCELMCLCRSCFVATPPALGYGVAAQVHPGTGDALPLQPPPRPPPKPARIGGATPPSVPPLPPRKPSEPAPAGGRKPELPPTGESPLPQRRASSSRMQAAIERFERKS